MSEFWPNFLTLETTNRCSERFMEALESGYGQNIPLMEFAPDGSPFYSASYGMSFAFVFYIYEQFGIDFVRTVLEDSNLSVAQAIDHQLPLFGYPDMDFRDVFFNFQMTLRLNKEEFDPKWGYHGLNIYVPVGETDNAVSLPVDVNLDVFHWAGESHSLNVNNPSFAALKYTFNGSSSGDFDVHVIGSSYYNYSYTEEYVSKMRINNDTQNGELVFILPEKVAYVYINVANANGPDYGYDVVNSEVYAELRDSASIHIETFNPGLVGTIDSLEYIDRTFTVTATVDWDLESTLEDNDLAPHVVLYDADGEFAFNLQAYLSYNAATESWNGTLDLTEDIKSGDYAIKLFVRGVELDTSEGKVTGSSAPSFLFLSLSLAFISLFLIRRRKD